MLLHHQDTVKHENNSQIQYKLTTMDIGIIKQIEREEPTEETLNLTDSREKLVKPCDYRRSNWIWERYKPPRQHRLELKTNTDGVTSVKKLLNMGAIEATQLGSGENIKETSTQIDTLKM